MAKIKNEKLESNSEKKLTRKKSIDRRKKNIKNKLID